MPRSNWIISPLWDLAYLVATPLLIVPAVTLLVRHQLTPEQVALAVISFASLGHHLPGFMRAYGDRELFERFRLRFLLAPPLALGLALLFTPPSWIAQTLKLPWTHLHGLELVLLVWGTWHGLMQTYGFMRIYDIRRGENTRLHGRLDHALCLVMFVGGVVFSDARVFGIANAMWQAGLPLFGPAWLAGLRLAVGVAGVIVAGLYAANLIAKVRAGQSVSLPKLSLAAITGWFFWYTGRLSTNLLIGLAMFEIYHAIQYYAIVWIYNRRLFERAGRRFGPLGFLFRDRYSMLGVYLALIAAYSSIRFFTGDGSDYIFTSKGGSDAYQWLFALFVASSMLHFYFDGFIWKVSEKKTQDNLVDQPGSAPAFDRYVPGLVHAAKWAVLLAIVAGLLLAERKLLAANPAELEAARREALARLTPDLPEVQILRSREALAEGRTAEAVRLARRAVALRPHAASVHADAGIVLLSAGKHAAARQLLTVAVERNPSDWQSHLDLAVAHQSLDDVGLAEAHFRRAVDLQPNLAQPRRQLTEFLRQNDRHDDAIAEATAWVRHSPQSHEAYYRLGLLLLTTGAPAEALAPLRTAARLKPDSFAAHAHLGDAFYALEKWPPATEAFRRAIEIDPESDDARVNLASAQFNAGQAEAAEATLRTALRDLPNSGKITFTLGILLQQLGQGAEAAALLERARELGIGK